VIATSSGAAAAYVKEGYTNIRLMPLEVAPRSSAGREVSGALISPSALRRLCCIVLLFTAAQSLRPQREPPDHDLEPRPAHRLVGIDVPTPADPSREVQGSRSLFLMFVAGALSAPLGIGSGSRQVLAMDRDAPAIQVSPLPATS
jgi:uncharacterized membrane protein YfcA